MRTIWTLMATIWGMVVPTCSAIFSFQTLSPHLLFHVVGHAGSDFVEFCSACCVIICHISQHHQNRRWCIFIKSVYFLTLIGLNNALVAKLTHMKHVLDQTRAVYLNLFLTEYSLWWSHSWTELKLRGKNDIIICPILQIWVINRVLGSESQSDGMKSKSNLYRQQRLGNGKRLNWPRKVREMKWTVWLVGGSRGTSRGRLGDPSGQGSCLGSPRGSRQTSRGSHGANGVLFDELWGSSHVR